MTPPTMTTLDDAVLPSRYTPRALAARLEPVPGGLELMGVALRDSALRAALWILTALRRDDARLWGHVDVRGGWISFRAILDEPGWTRAEQGALQAAWALLDDGMHVRLGALAEWLDDELWHAVLEALRLRREALDGGER